MKDFAWIINRLKAMKPREVLWRAGQKIEQIKDYNRYYLWSLPVTAIPFDFGLQSLHIEVEKLPVNWNNTKWTLFQGADIFGVYKYSDYKNKWNAGFQTENVWPVNDYSAEISISQRNDIGDIRTNWELNRHYQFSALAKSYYCTKDAEYLKELKNLFYDWNDRNLFLHGVEWASAMELAIRVNSWLYTYAFLFKAGIDDDLLTQLEHGIFIMTDYIMKHRARYSSANNHLIVEMYAVALIGIVADYAPWRDEALKILTEEIHKQNHKDGVNKEMSLHYQCFVMEAYGLLWLVLSKNNMKIPESWRSYISAMTEFVADSTDDFGTTIEFGDRDEGRILDLDGKKENYYQYVLNLMGCLLDHRYTDSVWHETLEWVIPEPKKGGKERYIPGLVCSRKEGGYTFLRSKDRRVLIGIDHAELGYGSIAAHGHADALSFQVYMDGLPILIDSGTFNYHVTKADRDYFRSTAAHNTVIIDGKNQSEIKGPFLWGRKARARLLAVEQENDEIKIRMEQDGYEPVKHFRTIVFDGEREIRIIDRLNIAADAEAVFILAPDIRAEETEDTVLLYRGTDRIATMRCGDRRIEQRFCSSRYGVKHLTKSIEVVLHNQCTVEIDLM